MLRRVRGENIDFAFTFTDGAGNVIGPGSATLYIAWNDNGFEQTTEITLVQVGDLWTGTWDSGDADPGRVTYHVLTGDKTVAEDGMLLLDGNLANFARSPGNSYDDYV